MIASLARHGTVPHDRGSKYARNESIHHAGLANVSTTRSVRVFYLPIEIRQSRRVSETFGERIAVDLQLGYLQHYRFTLGNYRLSFGIARS